jgi:hypothetical protein
MNSVGVCRAIGDVLDEKIAEIMTKIIKIFRGTWTTRKVS